MSPAMYLMHTDPGNDIKEAHSIFLSNGDFLYDKQGLIQSRHSLHFVFSLGRWISYALFKSSL